MGNIDRVIRITIALVVGALIATQTLAGTWAIVAGVVGAIFILTGLFGTCPLYSLFGMNTCPRKD